MGPKYREMAVLRRLVIKCTDFLLTESAVVTLLEIASFFNLQSLKTNGTRTNVAGISATKSTFAFSASTIAISRPTLSVSMRERALTADLSVFEE